jgi:plastocyanin domain-containing protein
MRFPIVLLAALALVAGCSPRATEVQVAVTEDGFVPEVVSVPRGVPATLVITRKTEATCATEAVFQKTGRKFDLPLNQAVRIPIETAAAETLAYACGMDMYRGQVIVQ